MEIRRRKQGSVPKTPKGMAGAAATSQLNRWKVEGAHVLFQSGSGGDVVPSSTGSTSSLVLAPPRRER